MRRKIIYSILIAAMVTTFTGCGEKEKVPKPIEGLYVSADGESSLRLSDYSSQSDLGENVYGKCSIQFQNVDLEAFENFAIYNSVSHYIFAKMQASCTDAERDEVIESYKSKIDVNNQFCDNKATFVYFYSEEDKGYGFMSEVNGSGFDGAYETYVTVEYISKDKAIICDEIKYVLEE